MSDYSHSDPYELNDHRFPSSLQILINNFGDKHE